MNLPPDRGHLSTEQQHPASFDLDARDVASCVNLITEDQTLAVEAVHAAEPSLTAFINALVPRVQSGGRLINVGAGTSGRLGVLDASECPPTFQSDPNQIVGIIAGGDAAMRRSSESQEDKADGAIADLQSLKLSRDDALLGIAAGGTTPYVLGAIEFAASVDALTGLLTCSTGVKTPTGCHHLIVLPTGPELLTGSTRLKAGTATKIALNIITTTLFVQLGKTYGNLMIDLRATNTKLYDRAIRILLTVHPELDRSGAAELLAHADGQLKAAIVMKHCGCSLADARERLQQHRGRVREVLHSTQVGT